HRALAGARVAAFGVVGRGYAHDGQRLWHRGQPVGGADVASFALVEPAAGEEADARDRHRRYRAGQPLPAASAARP
ncbi:MAG: hypothetical protein JNM08_13400, partial [Rubrivivax sp.]|nr:hypothetical protein [Rubrivivax sp.]